MSGLKIALLCDWFLPHRGGIELHLLDLARHLRARGHAPHLVTSIPGAGEVEAMPVHRLRSMLFPFFGFVWTPRPFRELARLLRRERYDVVHIHTSYIAPLAWGGALLSQRLGLPTVMTFHSRLLQFTRALSLANRALAWARWPVVFSGVSEDVREELGPLAPEQPIRILPNATDVGFWKAGGQGAKNGAGVVLVAVTRFSPRKRVGALLNIFADVRARLAAQVPVRLVIVGEGRLRWHLEHRIRRLGLQAHVHLTGYLPRPAIRDLFAEADIFVLPGPVESFGLAALEARAAGLPVVARAESGARAFIRHEREGLLAESDADAAGQIIRLIQDEPLRAAIARHNRATAPDYDWRDVIPLHLQTYDEARAKAASGPRWQAQLA